MNVTVSVCVVFLLQHGQTRTGQKITKLGLCRICLATWSNQNRTEHKKLGL